MKKSVMMLSVGVLLLGMVGCGPSLEEAFDEVQSNASSACKDWCAETVDCTWNDQDYEGEKSDENGLFDRDVKACVVGCAFSSSEGQYIIDVKDDGDQEITGKVSGGKAADVFACIWDLDLWECDKKPDPSEDHYYFMDYRGDETLCEELDDCYQKLEVEFECEWDDNGNLCICGGDEEVRGLTDLIFYPPN